MVFEWAPPADTSADIDDYQFELSAYADMRWPLSPNFRKLISLTADRGAARYRLPLVGMVAPDRTYYWRVRAKNEAGLWGPWSRVWHFILRGPAPPVGIRLDFDQHSSVGTLRWHSSWEGRRPAAYRVYASDEKGFSVHDEPYAIMEMYPGDWRTARLNGRAVGNFVAQTTDTELVVVGLGVCLPNANRAYYRVVSVDERATRSWSSDFVEALRPFIHTAPIVDARAGQEYRYAAPPSGRCVTWGTAGWYAQPPATGGRSLTRRR